MEVKVSTLYWQDSDPKDDRSIRIPDVYVPQTFAELTSGRDIVLEKALSCEPTEVDMVFFEEYSPRYRRHHNPQGATATNYF